MIGSSYASNRAAMQLSLIMVSGKITKPMDSAASLESNTVSDRLLFADDTEFADVCLALLPRHAQERGLTHECHGPVPEVRRGSCRCPLDRLKVLGDRSSLGDNEIGDRMNRERRVSASHGLVSHLSLLWESDQGVVVHQPTSALSMSPLTHTLHPLQYAHHVAPTREHQPWLLLCKQRQNSRDRALVFC